MILEGSSAPQYHRCSHCLFVFKDREDLPDSETSRARYLLHENSLENSGYVEYLKRFIASLDLEHPQRTTSILDYGSGPQPVLAHLLSEMGYQVDTYDLFFSPSEAYLGNQYDLITLLEVAEHLERPLEVLKTLRSLLDETGRIVIRTQLNGTTSDRQFLSWWYTRDVTHIGFFSEKSMQFIAEELDMKMVLKDANTVVFFLEKG